LWHPRPSVRIGVAFGTPTSNPSLEDEAAPERREAAVIIKDVAEITPIIAGDNSELRELLHPDRDRVELGYSLACAVVKPGRSTTPHKLESSEVYYLIFGSGVMHLGDEAAPVHAGHCVYIPKGESQWIENTGRIDLAFLCLVDPPWRPEDERILDDRSPDPES
jgi:mannose-6-phosphate isomerase-like protein (cupin superfamily)